MQLKQRKKVKTEFEKATEHKWRMQPLQMKRKFSS